jgi:chaperonin cofactor prefoldin
LIILGAIGTVFGTPSRSGQSRDEEMEILKMKVLRLRKQLAELESRIAILEKELRSKMREHKGNTEYQNMR